MSIKLMRKLVSCIDNVPQTDRMLFLLFQASLAGENIPFCIDEAVSWLIYNCLECEYGYFVNSVSWGTDECVHCSEYTDNCSYCNPKELHSGEMPYCSICIDGHTLVEDDVKPECRLCKEAISHCLNCSTSEQKCFKCEEGYTLTSAGYCSSCDMIDNCTSCDDDVQCVECTLGNYVSDGKCSTCGNAMEACVECDGATKCRKCHSVGYFLSDDTNMCDKCVANCTTCLNGDVCEVCNDGLGLYEGECLSVCPENMTISNGYCVVVPTADSGNSGSLGTGAIMGIVFGVIVILSIAAIVVFLVIRRRFAENELHSTTAGDDDQVRSVLLDQALP